MPLSRNGIVLSFKVFVAPTANQPAARLPFNCPVGMSALTVSSVQGCAAVVTRSPSSLGESFVVDGVQENLNFDVQV